MEVGFGALDGSIAVRFNFPNGWTVNIIPRNDLTSSIATWPTHLGPVEAAMCKAFQLIHSEAFDTEVAEYIAAIAKRPPYQSKRKSKVANDKPKS